MVSKEKIVMKYIDADRLKAEIERRMTENCELAKKVGEAFGHRAVEDNDILAFIDSLQQEQPDDLDEAAKEYLKQYNESEFGNGGDDWDDDILITFKAGAEWMQKQEEEYSPWLSINALEEASISFGEQAEMYGIGGQSFSEDMAVAFTRGAEWMAEQGWYEEAVIKGSDDVVWLNYNVELPIDLAKYFKDGDKVIVQIRKK